MFKKIVFISILFLLLITFYTPSWAAAPETSLAGDWMIDGTMKVVLNLKSSSSPFVNIVTDFRDLAAIGEIFTFTDNGTSKEFTDGLNYLVGPWSQNGKNFSVDLQIETLVAKLQETMPGVTAEKKVGSYFKGLILKNGQIKGKFNTVINISGSSSTTSSEGSDITGSTMTISGNFTGSSTSNKKAFQIKAKNRAQTVKENILNILQR